MDDAFLVRVLHAVAELQEQLEALARGEPLVVAIVGDATHPDKLHHEIWTALCGGAGSNTSRSLGGP